MGFLKDAKGVMTWNLSGDMGFDLDSAGSLGSVPVPGEKRIELPAGRVLITFEQAGKKTALTPGTSQGWKGPPVKIIVRRDDDAESLKTTPFKGANARGSWRTLKGSFEVPEAAKYTVTLSSRASLDDYTDPKLLFDLADTEGAGD